jgi:hypothetical protein
VKPGVRAQDIVIGTGDEAVRGKVAVVTVRVSLLDGTDLSGALLPTDKMRIDLGRRDCIAGLRYGIEGMRVGGQRELIISPHLAYGATGVPDRVPPNATLRCRVELLEVRERGVAKPEDYPPGRQLIVGWLGDLEHGVSKWQFGLHDDGRCGAMVQVPITGLKWRHARPKIVDVKVDPVRAAALIDSAVAMPERYPRDCLTNDQVCVDHSGHDGGVHRQRATDTLCYAVTIWERGTHSGYYLTENSQAWLTWEVRAVIRDLVGGK